MADMMAAIEMAQRFEQEHKDTDWDQEDWLSATSEFIEKEINKLKKGGVAMECKLEISYNWKCDQGIEIPEKHKEALKEDAMERIFEMVKEDYLRELSTTVRYGKDVVPEDR